MDLSPSPRGRDTIRPQLTGQIQGRQPKSLGLELSEGVRPVRNFEVPVTETPGSGGFGQNHSPEVERGEKASTRSPSPLNQLERPLVSSPRSFLTFALCSAPLARLLRAHQCRAPPVAPRPPPPARGTARRARVQAQVIKALLRQPTADSRCARKSWGRVQPATGRDPAFRQQSPQLLRPQPIPLQSPPSSLNPPLCRYRRQDR